MGAESFSVHVPLTEERCLLLDQQYVWCFHRSFTAAQQHSVRTLEELKQRSDDEKAADAARAVTELNTAAILFKALDKLAQAEKTALDPKAVAIHLQFCQHALQKAQAFQESVRLLILWSFLRCEHAMPANWPALVLPAQKAQ